MSGVLQILRVLLLRALSEHGRGGAALNDVYIERTPEGFDPRLTAVFADGFRVALPVRTTDCYAYCVQRSIRDQESLRFALMNEARALYAQMDEDWANARGGGERHDRLSNPPLLAPVGLMQRIRRWCQGIQRTYPRQGEALRPTDRRAQRGGQFANEVFRFRGSVREGIHPRAEARGLELLRENLSPMQRTQFARHQSFDVLGGKTGNRYRIRYGRQMNIEQIDKRGRRICGWCFFPQGGLVAGDVMLGQKLALELFEPEALAIAQRYRVAQGPDFPP